MTAGHPPGGVDPAHLPSYLTQVRVPLQPLRPRSPGMVFYAVLEFDAVRAPVRCHDSVADAQPRENPPEPPTGRRHPPSVERPPADRTWRSTRDERGVRSQLETSGTPATRPGSGPSPGALATRAETTRMPASTSYGPLGACSPDRPTEHRAPQSIRWTMTSYAFFGAPLDTGNLGVSALAIATMVGIAVRDPHAEVALFDFAKGTAPASLHWPCGELTYVRRGAYRSRRFHRPENLWTMYVAARVAPAANANVRAIDRADVVLDISGGDSFTDLYGARRFVSVTMPKRIALQRRRPLHLLPQTFGPYRTRSAREMAERIVRGAETAWARDEHSFATLRDLLGDAFDPNRHRSGVDVAFLLPSSDLPETDADQLLATSSAPIVGLNVSGLLSNAPGIGRERFGLSVDYPSAMQALVRRFVERTEARILLIPHVYGQLHESDHIACQRMLDKVETPPDRVQVAARPDAMQTKALIGACDWFVGTRMHSTIAALSQSIPTAAVAYSDKTAGVFATCGVSDQVVDARHIGTGDLVDALWERWERREHTRGTLQGTVPGVIRRAEAQLDEIARSP